MNDRLPSCDKHHLGVISELVIDHAEGKSRRRCLICMRVRAKASYHRAIVRQPTPTAYGVLPRLSWPAPEFMVSKF